MVGTISMKSRGARGESFADIARRVGEIEGIPIASDATDEDVMAVVGRVLTEAERQPALNFANSNDGVPAIPSVSSPSARYDTSIDGNGWLTFTNTFSGGNTYAFVFRSNITRLAGRVYSATIALSATNYTAGQTAPAIGFDTARQTGADAVLTADNVFFVWRNGLVLAECFFDGGAATPTGYTITPEAADAHVVGDLLEMQLTELEDGSGELRCFKNGVLKSTHAINHLPPGLFVAGVRLTDSGVGTLREMRAGDTIVNTSITNELNPNVSSLLPSAPIGIARTNMASPAIDAAAVAAPTRAMVPGMPDMPLKPLIVRSVGDVTVSNTALGQFMARYPDIASGSVAYVAPGGNNGTGALNNPALPFASINYALQSTAARIVIVEDGGYSPIRYDWNHGSSLPKVVIARNRGGAVLRSSGDAISGLTWTNTGDGIWKTTLFSAAVADVLRVLVGTSLDFFGYPSRLLKFSYVSGEAALRSAGTGFMYNTSTKELFVGLGGANVESAKSALRALYASISDSGESRCLLYGSRLAMDGLTYDGVKVQGLAFDDGGVQRVPDIAISNFVTQFNPGYALSLTDGGLFVAENGRAHASELDGYNQNWGTDGDACVGNIVGVLFSETGDTSTFSIGVEKNRQAISAHAGHLLAIGVIGQRSWGDEFFDTSVSDAPSLSHYVACMAGGMHPDLVYDTAGFNISGGNFSAPYARKAWFDSCVVTSDYPRSTSIIEGASAKGFNNIAPSPPFGSALTAFTPDAP